MAGDHFGAIAKGESQEPVPPEVAQAAEVEERQSAQEQLSARHYRWKLTWFPARSVVAWGSAAVWAGLTSLVGKGMWQVWNQGFESVPYALTGTFAAWLALSATIYKTLSPQRRDSIDRVVERTVRRLREGRDDL